MSIVGPITKTSAVGAPAHAMSQAPLAAKKKVDDSYGPAKLDGPLKISSVREARGVKALDLVEEPISTSLPLHDLGEIATSARTPRRET